MNALNDNDNGNEKCSLLLAMVFGEPFHLDFSALERVLCCSLFHENLCSVTL